MDLDSITSVLQEETSHHISTRTTNASDDSVHTEVVQRSEEIEERKVIEERGESSDTDGNISLLNEATDPREEEEGEEHFEAREYKDPVTEDYKLDFNNFCATVKHPTHSPEHQIRTPLKNELFERF